MTTQSAVISAFLDGDTHPSQASNFEMEILDDGYTAALIGDGRAVLAYREPVRSFTLYTGRISSMRDRDWTQDIHNGALRRQQRMVQRRVRAVIDEDTPMMNAISERPPEPEDTRFNVDG